MKKLLVLFFLIGLPNLVQAQEAEEILKRYYDNLSNIENLSYRIHNIDTFLTGQVWDKKGHAILKRNEEEPASGFIFYGIQDGHPESNVFDGKEYYRINHQEKTFQKHEGVLRTAIGLSGGQMVLSELVFEELPTEKLELEVKEKVYILRFYFPDSKTFGVENRYKELHLDKKTLIPIYKYHILESLGEKQVNISMLAEIKINDPDFVDSFEGNSFLSGLEYLPPKDVENKLLRLANQPAPELKLTSTEGAPAKLSDQKGKVILLDFFEIWCGPCIQSVPKLKEIADKYSKEDFALWGIVSDEKTFKKVPEFISKKSLNYPNFYGTEESSSDYFLRGVPQYIIVDKEGKVVFAHLGYSDKMEKVLDDLLQKD
ncbi:MAG: TlpA disulfide reductase family protein [Anditalea sp.]